MRRKKNRISLYIQYTEWNDYRLLRVCFYSTRLQQKKQRAIQNQQVATVREKEGIKKLPGLIVPVKPDQESQSGGVSVEIKLENYAGFRFLGLVNGFPEDWLGREEDQLVQELISWTVEIGIASVLCPCAWHMVGILPMPGEKKS